MNFGCKSDSIFLELKWLSSCYSCLECVPPQLMSFKFWPRSHCSASLLPAPLFPGSHGTLRAPGPRPLLAQGEHREPLTGSWKVTEERSAFQSRLCHAEVL